MKKEPLTLDVEALWQKRAGEHLAETIHYWRLIGSSGLLFTAIVLFILGLMYYEDFLNLIPVWLPIPLLFSILLAGVITRVRHRTLLEEADLLFLTPIEVKMERYFQKASFYNFAVQIIALGLILFILTPIYTHKIPEANQQLLLYMIIPVVLKGWNIQSTWTAYRIQEQSKVIYHAVFRFCFNFSILFLFFSGGKIGQFSVWGFMMPVLIIALVLFYLIERKWKEKHALHWTYLLEMESNLKSRFYQFANAFVDVPHLRSKVRKRAWLSFVTAWLPFHPRQSYRYLYLKTFIRANEYLGMYVRLTLLGMLILYFIPDIYARGVVFILFLYLIGTQIRPIWGHHLRQFWISLYPLPQNWQRESFAWMCTLLLGIEAIFMLLPSLFQLQYLAHNGVLLGLGLAFSILYPKVLMKKK